MAGCESCNTLRTYAAEFMANGVTAKVCQSLQDNTGLNPDLSVLHNNCDDIGNVVDCLSSALESALKNADPCHWEEFLTLLLNNYRIINDVLVCNECGQWHQIDLIWEEIRNIYTILDTLTGGASYRTMTPGVDYDTIFFNGWYSDSGNVRVRYVETAGYYDIIMDSPTSSNEVYRVRHDDLIAANILMKHGDDLDDVPTSRIWGVNFKGRFASLQNMTLRSTGIEGVWNLRPRDLRMAWTAYGGINENHSGCKALVNWTTYADGYNQQLNIPPYTSLNAWTGTVYAAGINFTGNFLLIK